MRTGRHGAYLAPAASRQTAAETSQPPTGAMADRYLNRRENLDRVKNKTAVR